ncbi:hypothetical protein ACSBR1_038410 [Camellia fascicularis]
MGTLTLLPLERIEAKNLFSSEEAEEQAKKESAKTFVPDEKCNRVSCSSYCRRFR